MSSDKIQANFLIKLSDGREGKLKQGDSTVKGKCLVYLENGDKILKSSDEFTVMGFWEKNK